MQIQLKQAEIIAAIKGYISSQGINLTGKDVTIAFTAGRKESGLTADISIEEGLQPMSNFFKEKEASTTMEVVEPVPTPAAEPEAIAAEEPVAEAPKTTSLFS